MTDFQGSACAKAILAGEHAVVYGHPAVAIPLLSLEARVRITPRASSKVEIFSPGMDLCLTLPGSTGPQAEPFSLLLELMARETDTPMTGLSFLIDSDIPVGRGLGSGAAVSVACLRALGSRAGKVLKPERISDLAFEVEKLHHETPSGVDNATIAFERPLVFQQNRSPEFLDAGAFTFVMADAGPAPPTREQVRKVRDQLAAFRPETRALLREIGEVAREAARLLPAGSAPDLGRLLDRNHELLCSLGLSSPLMDRLCEQARRSGALGAKLTGAGGGGFLLAVVEGDEMEVRDALLSLGAEDAWVIHL